MNTGNLKISLAVCLALSAVPFAGAHAAKFTDIYRFPRTEKKGWAPAGQLTLGADGNFYGTTIGGGSQYFGTVFKVTPQEQLTLLHSFAGAPDGASPYGAVLLDADGNLYGTTSGGGAISDNGTVFKITPDGTETVLHSFGGDGDGAMPLTGLTADGIGNFYGVTDKGGSDNLGTIFSIAPSGQETILHSFDNTNSDAGGASPDGRLLRDQDGTLYGTTKYGGTNGRGTVFRFSQDGVFSILYSFGGSPDGRYPSAGLVFGRGGDLYGTTSHGGDKKPFGTVFRLTLKGREKPVFQFLAKTGENPVSDLVADAKGNLYGTAYSGGARKRLGTVFKLNPTTGEETLLHTFEGPEGSAPAAGLTFDASGMLYGVSTSENYFMAPTAGTIFKVVP